MKQPVVRSESGAVSLFIVIFSALLITIITVAFVRIMIQEQQQATATDLSKSALDSAYAGVEDAKRAIVNYRQCDGDMTGDCGKLTNALNLRHCTTLQEAGIAGGSTDKEVKIQQTATDTQLDQAYTCVKVQLNTVDYLGEISSGNSRLIHLKSTAPFSQVTIEWYSQKDLQAGESDSASSGNVNSDDSDNKVNLYGQKPDENQVVPPLSTLSDWPKNRPALLRVQLLQYDQKIGFTLPELNQKEGNNINTSDNASLFLYPSTSGANETIPTSFSNDSGPTNASTTLQQVGCDQTFSTTGGKGAYACSVTITVPTPIGATDNVSRDAYLRVDELYNTSTNFRVTMQDTANNPVAFSAVQPAVDSTGRANSLFRRVSSRIDLESSSIPNLQAAVDISGSLCKAFTVTDDPGDYDPGSCTDKASSLPH